MKVICNGVWTAVRALRKVDGAGIKTRVHYAQT
jgi:hypothetical protein